MRLRSQNRPRVSRHPVIAAAKDAWLSKALRAGVRAVLPRDVAPEQLRAALEAAAAGLLVIHPSELDTVLSATVGPSAPLDELLSP